MTYSFSLAAAWAVLALASSTANAFTTNPIHRGMAKPIDSRVSRSAEPLQNEVIAISDSSSEFKDYPFEETVSVDATLVYPQTLVYPPNIPSKILKSTTAGDNVTAASKKLRKAAQNRTFLFNGKHYVKYEWSLKDDELIGKQGNDRPIKARRGLEDYPFAGVDACLVFPERIKENTAFFFCENEFAEYDLQSLSNGRVNGIKLISDAFPGFPFPKVDAVISLEDRALFFYEKEYAVWHFRLETFVEKNKEIVNAFEGFPFTTIDAALTLPYDDGKLNVYLFSGDKYVKYVDWKFQEDTGTSDSATVMDEDSKDNKLNFRFDKISTKADVLPSNTFPSKTKADYRPLKMSAFLKEKTRADSVVVEGDFQLLEYRGKKVEELWEQDNLTGAKINPLYPEDATFWEEFKEVVEVQKLRRKKGKKEIIQRADENDLLSKYSNWPKLWFNRTKSELNPWGENDPDEGLTLEKVARSVAGEFSNYHQQVLLKELTAGEGVKLSADIGLRFRSDKDFIGMEVRMGTINAWSLEAVGPVNFMLKWYYGVPRPEEVAWHIKCGNLKKGVPKDVVALIDKMEFDNPFKFTAYEKGSPTHPSFPAMHSAGSTCSLWIPTLYQLNSDQYLETLRTDYSVAFARTVAGVHYPQDNIAGLNIGQRIIREKLPKFLAENYGYDEEAVRTKVEALSFDWKNVKFTKEGCTINEKTHEEFLKDALGE